MKSPELFKEANPDLVEELEYGSIEGKDASTIYVKTENELYLRHAYMRFCLEQNCLPYTIVVGGAPKERSPQTNAKKSLFGRSKS